MSKKFEYQDEYQDPMNKTWHKVLEEKGLDGWELVSITPYQWETDKSGYSYVKEYCYMFKREIK
jgi:hypothetical protein